MKKEDDINIESCLKSLQKYKVYFTKQQIKTLKGQIFAGDYLGFYRGAVKILRRKIKEKMHGKTKKRN